MLGGRAVAELNALDREFCAFATRVLGAVEYGPELSSVPERAAPTAQGVTERGQRILLLYQPVATDFRQVVAILRMVVELERVEQLARENAEGEADLTGLPTSFDCDLERVKGVVAKALNTALSAYEANDHSVARRALKLCREVPERVARQTDRIAELMKADPATVIPGLRLFTAAQRLQFMARHVAEIATEVLLLADAARDGTLHIADRPGTLPR